LLKANVEGAAEPACASSKRKKAVTALACIALNAVAGAHSGVCLQRSRVRGRSGPRAH
jgi:hypothetical protein